jgi:nitroreductase
MDVREALYTTRAMRRVKPDPIPQDVVARILDAAIRAPSGGNMQTWRFLVVTDPAVRNKLAPLYKDCIAQLWTTIYAAKCEAAEKDPDDPENAAWLRIKRSAQWLADHFAEVPMLLFGFGDASSVYQALWNAQLAARAEGVGSALTSVMGVFHKQETLDVLGLPAEGAPNFVACVTFGYPTGRWGVAQRNPVESVMYENQWGTPVSFPVGGPLFNP